jgi:acyl carrier protein
MDNIEQRIKEIMCDCFDLEMDQLTDDADLVKDLGVDSISVVEMIVDIEDEFGIEIQDKDISNYLTVSKAVNAIKSQIENK